MADDLRWGVLGASSFAARTMAPAIHMSAGARLAALATSSVDKAAPFRDIDSRIEVFDDYDAMIASDAVDVIYIPLPNHLHVDWTVKALEAGKHVLCEKPVAMAESDFDRLIDTRDAAGKLAAEAYMIAHHPQWYRVRELLGEGKIGDLRRIDVAFSFHNADPTDIRNQAATGGGGMRDIGVYAMGCARLVTDEEPTDLVADLEMQDGYDTFAEIRAQFPSFRYSAMVSTRLAPRQSVTFHGTEGHITLTAPFNAGKYDQAELVLENGLNERTVMRWPGTNHYVLQVEAFCRAAMGTADFPWPLERARGTQAMIDRALSFAGS